ncbi:signal peptidase II [Chlorobium sp. BLA1]|uniref:signal peptidase II n=1 Tax=Candidatus Chlorobium masyuteum TaxID=2716876 RepID=UPI00141FB404|nr:signal peptidase II [Candidatus Chlorobium masyuteum]NHQ60173.1 signal peptidase II [Candidatus Chlorobium masyuteum]NTU44564.1 signal peptidase II [Chlorobiaceae bacterium]
MKLFLSLILLVITADQLTKKLAVTLLRDSAQTFTIIPNLFSLTYAENKGVAFGVEFAPPAVLLLLTGLITATVVFYVIRSKNRSPLFLLSFGLIVGGGIGNMIDRVSIGHVIDFIYFDLYHGNIFGTWVSLWPIFNVADSAITTGACMLILFYNRVFPDATAREQNNAG